MPIFMQMGLPTESPRLKGPVKDPPHVDWFELSSVQFGTSQHAVHSSGRSGRSPSTGQREGGQPVTSELVLTMPSDESNLFFKASLDGEAFKTVIIDFDRDGQSYLVLKLKDVLISGYSLSSGGDRPTASITLNFTDIEYHYSPASARSGSAAANPVGEVLPLMVLRHLVNAVMGP